MTELSKEEKLVKIKTALHIANQLLHELQTIPPGELLDLFDDPKDPTAPQDRFTFISTCLLNLNANLSDARITLVNLGQFSTIENWKSKHEKTPTWEEPKEDDD